MMPDHAKPFQIETDASKYATSAVLTQLDSNSDRHLVSFISKTLSPTDTSSGSWYQSWSNISRMSTQIS